MALWDSPQQREAYAWFFTELANLRAAFRWSADRGNLDAAVTIAILATFVGVWVETYEPISWVEEILDDAVAANHPRLGFAYTLVAQSFLAGRIEEAVGYSDAGQRVIHQRVRRCPSVSMAGSGLRTCPSDRPIAGSNGLAHSVSVTVTPMG